MAARKKTTAAAADTPTEAPAAAPVEAALVDESESDTGTAAVPVHTIKVVLSGDQPVRAGGHVLTEQGWIPETQVGEAGS